MFLKGNKTISLHSLWKMKVFVSYMYAFLRKIKKSSRNNINFFSHPKVKEINARVVVMLRTGLN